MKRQREDCLSDDTIVNEFESKSDVELIYDSVIARLSSAKSVRGVLVTQLRALHIDDSQFVDMLHKLRRNCNYRYMSCSYAGVQTDSIMKRNDYLGELDIWKNSEDLMKRQFFEKFSLWVDNCPNISLFESDLLRGGSGNEKVAGLEASMKLTIAEIDQLISRGYLRKGRNVTTNTVYYFSHPQLGVLLSKITESRKAILDFIRMRRYKEIYMKELRERSGITAPEACNTPAHKKVKSSSVVKSLACSTMQGIHFHVLDLIGNGDVTRTITPLGELIRLK